MKTVLLLTLVISTAVLSACANTAEGFGKDVESAGQEIQRTF